MTPQVSALWIYPIKSLPSVSMDTMAFDPFGPQYDRRYMLIDASGRFISQRQHPELTQLKLINEAEGWRVMLPDGSHSILVSRLGNCDSVTQATIWQDEVLLYDQGSVFSAFFSDYLKKDVRLVYQSHQSHRLIDPNYVDEEKRRDVSLADGFPILIANMASLDHINSTHGLNLDMLRFRPNIVVEHAPPFAENTWSSIEISDNQFQLVKPCSRCVIPTIDPHTAKKQPDVWQALKEECEGDDGVIYFGHNMIHKTFATISKGDAVMTSCI